MPSSFNGSKSCDVRLIESDPYVRLGQWIFLIAIHVLCGMVAGLLGIGRVLGLHLAQMGMRVQLLLLQRNLSASDIVSASLNSLAFVAGLYVFWR